MVSSEVALLIAGARKNGAIVAGIVSLTGVGALVVNFPPPNAQWIEMALMSLMLAATLWAPTALLLVPVNWCFRKAGELVLARWLASASADRISPAILLACGPDEVACRLLNLDGYVRLGGTIRGRLFLKAHRHLQPGGDGEHVGAALRDRTDELNVGPESIRQLVGWVEIRRPFGFCLEYTDLRDEYSALAPVLSVCGGPGYHRRSKMVDGNLLKKVLLPLADISIDESRRLTGWLRSTTEAGRTPASSPSQAAKDSWRARRNLQDAVEPLWKAHAAMSGQGRKAIDTLLRRRRMDVRIALKVAEALSRASESTQTVAAQLAEIWEADPEDLVSTADLLRR